MFGRESLKEFMRGEQEKSRRALEELREFNREILLRNEKVYTSVIAELKRLTEESRETTERTRAGTQAILRLLDRFDERGGDAAA